MGVFCNVLDICAGANKLIKLELVVYHVDVSLRGEGLQITNFFPSEISFIFHHCQNASYLLNTTFMFDRRRRSSAAGTSVKCECG